MSHPGYSPSIFLQIVYVSFSSSKQEFANIHVSLGWIWAKYTQGSAGILKLIV